MSRAALRARARRSLELLDEIYPEIIQFLNFRSPFELLIGVILSAQTTDRQVNLVTPELFRRWPTAEALAQADPAKEVEPVIRSIGFFRTKARNICATARLVIEGVPKTMDELLKLPGVGRKSANVILGTLYGKPALIVDTHCGRVARRLGLSLRSDPLGIERDLALVVAPTDQYRFSMKINNHGRRYCHARKPDCPACVLRDICPSAQLSGT